MEFLALIPLFFMIRSDFRRRVVGLMPLFLFGILQFGIAFWVNGWVLTLLRLFHNNALLLLWGFCLLTYLTIKNRGLINPFKGYLGEGDVIFIFFLTPFFDVYNFVVFLVASLLISTAGWLIYYLINKKNISVPLVSTVGICYIFYIASSYFFHFNF